MSSSSDSNSLTGANNSGLSLDRALRPLFPRAKPSSAAGDPAKPRAAPAQASAHLSDAEPAAKSASIAILLCTFNGARFLSPQLASYEAQNFSDWCLYVSDDGSSDDTLLLLWEFQAKHGANKVHIRRGPGRGVVANFLSLICDRAINADYYALSDQDDVWAPDKLTRAQSFLDSRSDDVPVVYCSRATLIDHAGAQIGVTPLFRKGPSFRNALVQNVAGGNTMVFNERARSILMRAGPDANAAVHDWWVYLTTTAVGGTVFYDPHPTVAYRMHSGNLIGSKDRRLRRSQMLLSRFRRWNDLNIRALERIQDDMPQDNRRAFDLFRHARTLSLLPRIYGLLRSGVRRETMLENVHLALAALVGQI
jgi:glycosyltransferase involved in cell wall biosynthesis